MQIDNFFKIFNLAQTNNKNFMIKNFISTQAKIINKLSFKKQENLTKTL